MSESVIADFVGKFNSEGSENGEPARGRVLLSQKRLVLAADSDMTVTIPLSAVFDISVGHVPEHLGDFFDSTVTVAFERNDRRLVAAVEGNDENIDKFSTVLFKAILNDTTMTIKHPAEVGGRVTDEPFRTAKLEIGPKLVRFRTKEEVVSVPLSMVTNFDRESRDIGGADRPVLKVRHMPEGQALTTLAATKSPRKMSILGRYLRIEYTDLIGDLKDVGLSDDEKELLVAIYSAGDMEGVPLANIIGADASQVTMLLNRMEEHELVVDNEEGTTLTPKGRVVVSNQLEDVNS
jgi:helix-turn-helix protein